MATRVQFRRGTYLEHASFTGAAGEITVNTSNNTVHVHNGSTAGGFELAKKSDAPSISNTAPISAVTAAGAVTISHLNSGVTASTYGGASAIPIFTVNATGHITSASNVSVSAGITLTDQTSTATTQYLMMTNASSGSQSTANVSTTKLYFTPSTGQLNATDFNSLSDKQFKKEIKTINDALSIIEDLRGVTFKWKDNNLDGIGLIAQEVKDVLPFAVSIDDAGVMSVKYGNLIGVLIEAVKEQQSQINTLKEQVKKLNG